MSMVLMEGDLLPFHMQYNKHICCGENSVGTSYLVQFSPPKRGQVRLTQQVLKSLKSTNCNYRYDAHSLQIVNKDKCIVQFSAIFIIECSQCAPSDSLCMITGSQKMDFIASNTEVYTSQEKKKSSSLLEGRIFTVQLPRSGHFTRSFTPVIFIQ